jgi:hypothetical protein
MIIDISMSSSSATTALLIQEGLLSHPMVRKKYGIANKGLVISRIIEPLNKTNILLMAAHNYENLAGDITTGLTATTQEVTEHK